MTARSEAPALAHQARRQARHLAEFLGGARRLRRQRQQRFGGNHAEGRAIELRADRVTPGQQLAQDREAAAPQRAGSLHAQPRVAVGLRRRPAHALQALEFLLGPRTAAERLQGGTQALAERQQIAGIGRGVLEHFGRERPARPVRPLILLVQAHADVFFEQRRQADRRLAEQVGRDARVEQVARMEAVVPVENAQVVVAVVEDDLHGRIRQQRPQSRHVRDGQRIDDGGFFATRQLDEIDAVHEPMEARRLRIQRHQRLAGGPRGEGGKLLVGPHVVLGREPIRRLHHGFEACPRLRTGATGKAGIMHVSTEM